MHPFHKALHKKKMEGLMISIHPASHDESREEMQQAASRGDGAPEVLDKDEDPSVTGAPVEGSPAEEAGESPAFEAKEDAPQVPHKPPAHQPPHHKKSTSLREKAEIEMKKKGY